MIDGIIKDNGTSRLMLATLPATYEEFRAAVAAGTQALDILFNAAGWSQLPDFLNKANLLKDATALAYGLTAAAVPDDVLSLLSRFNSGLGNEYVWERRKEVINETLTDLATETLVDGSDGGEAVTIYYSDEVVISAPNCWELKNPTTLSVSYNGYTNANVLAGKYYSKWKSNTSTPSSGNSALRKGSATGTATRDSSSGYKVYFPSQFVTAVNTVVTLSEYLNSPDPSAYPPAVSDGYTYMALGKLGAKGCTGDNGPAVSVIVDSKLSDTSINPVQNKVIKSALDALRDMVYPMDTHYPGVDLTGKFVDEIAAAPYSGDAWAWIKARIKAGNYTGIHVKDFIPFTTTNGVTLRAEVAGIDTYLNYGDKVVGHHIDFICRELWPTRKPINPFKYNNGLIPAENITLDGVATSYTLAKEMNDIASITKDGEGLTGWHYDSSTFTITFDAAPKAGTAVVTGTGTEYPWLACDLYHWLNSLSGQVPNSGGLNPTVKHVDYTQDGVYYYLPQELKNVIIEKRFFLMMRYSETGLLSDDNSGGWENIGKLWLPTEPEVYGMPVWGGKSGHSLGGSAVQYPIFMGNMNRVKYRSGTRSTWWLLTPYTSQTQWCSVNADGRAANFYASNENINTPVCFRVG